MDTSPKWVEKLFSRLAIHYGSRWMNLWAGIDLAAVKASWEHSLSDVYQRAPHAIAYALDNLPDDPPNVAQFRKLCNSRPADPVQMLPAPAADPARVAAAVKALVKPKPARPLEWAHRLKEREERGDRSLTPFQRDAWRAVLQSREPAEAVQ